MIEKEDKNEIVSNLNAVSTFEHVTPEQITNGQGAVKSSNSQAGISVSHSW